MFETIYRTVVAEFDLCAAGPVIIGSSTDNELELTLADKTFLMGSNGNEKAFVIPGSSIKGVIRSYMEEIMDKSAAENLFGFISKEKDIKSQKGRLSFSDAYADMNTIKSNTRFFTAINPILQNAQNGSLNSMQVVEKGIFKAGFKLVNYNEDELKTIFKTFLKINSGEVCFGGKKSAGFGRMKIENFKMTVYGGYNEKLERITEKEYTDFDSCVKEVLGEDV